MEIKKGTNTVHEKEFYCITKKGYRIAVVRGPGCFLSDEDLKEILQEHIKNRNA